MKEGVRQSLQEVASLPPALNTGFLLGLFFDPEDGGHMFL
jgi:hypothetical protein